jgi:hypothetical protein
MFDLKTMITSALTAIVVAVVVVMLVGSNTPAIGGDTRFPNSVLGAKALTLSNGSATTTLTTGKVCFVVTQQDGDVSYAFFNTVGTLATSSVACN